MPTQSANRNLNDARNAKNDEFYTQYRDIEKEVNAYLEYNPKVFEGKTILLPCDDPEWSNFTKYFAQNFKTFGLNKLISTSYATESKNYKINYQPTLFEKNNPQFSEVKSITNGKTLLSSTQVIINIIDGLKFCISKNKVTLKSIFEILIYLTKILIIIFFWIGFLSYPLIIGWYLFYTEVTYQLLVFDGSLFTEFMMFTIFVAINYLHDKKLFSYLMVYGAIVCTLTFIGINNRKKARLIISGQPTHYVTYSIESKLISTNENYLFIGVIKNYLFFRNSIDGSNSIVKIEDVSKLRIKKLIN